MKSYNIKILGDRRQSRSELTTFWNSRLTYCQRGKAEDIIVHIKSFRDYIIAQRLTTTFLHENSEGYLWSGKKVFTIPKTVDTETVGSNGVYPFTIGLWRPSIIYKNNIYFNVQTNIYLNNYLLCLRKY